MVENGVAVEGENPVLLNGVVKELGKEVKLGREGAEAPLSGGRVG